MRLDYLQCLNWQSLVCAFSRHDQNTPKLAKSPDFTQDTAVGHQPSWACQRLKQTVTIPQPWGSQLAGHGVGFDRLLGSRNTPGTGTSSRRLCQEDDSTDFKATSSNKDQPWSHQCKALAMDEHTLASNKQVLSQPKTQSGERNLETYTLITGESDVRNATCINVLSVSGEECFLTKKEKVKITR